MKKKNKIIKKDIKEVLVENYMPYAVSTVEDRAIVGIDGMKPVHRRVLFSMVSDGLTRGNRVKSAKAVGNVLKYHPHGDSSVYDTIVRLSQEDSMNIPLVDGKGNLGEHTSSELQPAHMRYTEVRLNPIVKELFEDIEKMDSIMSYNYDDTALEPLMLPTKFPHILANISLGIATGMGSSIAGFDLGELCDATIGLIEDENIDLLSILKAPDFPTGGEIIYNEKQMKAIIETGRGKVKLRGKVVNDEKNNCLLIKEIPYGTTREAIIKKVLELVKDKKLPEIVDINDLTDLKGMEIEIEYKKNTNVELLLNKLFKLTPLEDSFSCNFNILIDNRPKVLGIRDILKEWVKFRVKCIREATTFDIKELEKELNILKGYEIILENLDRIVEILRFSENEEVIVTTLANEFLLNEEQITNIINMRLKNINYKTLKSKVDEYENILKNKKGLENILNDDRAAHNKIVTELNYIKDKYSTKRKSKILDKVDEITEEDLIESYPVKICLSEQGYIKKIKTNGYRATNVYNLKDGDSILSVIDADNKGSILLFTNDGNVIRKKVNDLEDVKMSQVGSYLNNIIDLDTDEKVIKVVYTDDFKGNILFIYKNGKIAKIPLSSYNGSRVKLLNAYNIESKLVEILLGNVEEILLKSNLDKVMVFSTEEVPVTMSKSSKGVVCMKSKDESYVVSAYDSSTLDTDCLMIHYYRVKRNAIGKYKRKTDEIKQK